MDIRNISEEIAMKYWAKGNDACYEDIVNRVVNHVLSPEVFGDVDRARIRRKILNKEFMPNSPVFMNAGTELKSLAACFVLPLDDSMDSIFTLAKEMAMVMKEGGGVGFTLSRLRPDGACVKTTKGVSSGPISFLKVYDSIVHAVKQGGTRRGAALANLRVDHPNIREFVRCKSEEGDISNFNISVAITDKFMEALLADQTIDLTHPKTGVVGFLPAKQIWDAIIDGMWRNGEPGIQFIDTVNTLKIPYLAKYEQHNTGIETSNPCSETFLRPYESCNIGSINLYAYTVPFWDERAGIKDGRVHGFVDMEALKETVRDGVDFMNGVIDVSETPVEEINRVTKESRKVGLGVMGVADMLSACGVPYHSEEGVALVRHILEEITKTAEAYSEDMGYRNSTLTLIAPTGTTGAVAGVSSGIEPHFRLMYERESVKAGKFIMVARSMSDFMSKLAPATKAQMEETLKKNNGVLPDGSEYTIGEGTKIPLWLLWPTADRISPDAHLAMLAQAQTAIHNSISKTMNLPNNATREEISRIAINAWKSGVKGFTVYRDGSRNVQVLSEINKKQPQDADPEPAEAKRDRPQETSGQTTKIKIGCGNLYVTTNQDENGPCEVFTNLGRSGGCPSQSEAASRLISLCLRSNVPVEEVVDQLVGIRCMSTIAKKRHKLPTGETVLSCPDAIGKCLRSFSKGVKAPERVTDSDEEDSAVKCPDCGGVTFQDGGCRTCPCGYSKCG